MSDTNGLGLLGAGFMVLALAVLFSSNMITSTYVANDNVVISLDDNGNLDAFGRLRVSTVTSIIDIKHIYDKEPLFVDERVNGDGVATWKEAGIELNTSSSGDYVVRQTYQRAFYQNGKSQQIFLTFDNLHPQTNIIKRIGYFTSTNETPYNSGFDGLFLSSENGTVYTNIYKGGVLMERVAQADWNLNTMTHVDWAKSQILQIDFEWLGVGRVRWALVIDGKIVTFHETDNANNIDGVYMLSPNKPIRWEIRQTGLGSGTFTTICATVGTEGSVNRLGVERSVNTDAVSIPANTVGTKYSVVGIRLNPDRLDKVIDILRFSLLTIDQNKNFYWELHLNPTLNVDPTWENTSNGAVDYFIGGSTVTTDGIIVESGFGVGRALSSDSIDSALRLGSNLGDTPQTMVLIVSPLSINMNVHGSLTFRELR